jgi:hypothetical protein
MLRVKNMLSDKGNYIANQFMINNTLDENNYTIFFQSYNSIIAERIVLNGKEFINLDEKYWNYSRTTSKYRSQFLGESTKETEKKIKDGTYQLTNLN